MYDRDVLSKIITKIKALEDVISGGGSGSSGTVLLTYTVDTETDPDYDIYTLNKTAGEIISALEEGNYICAYSSASDEYGSLYTQTVVNTVSLNDGTYQIELYIDLYNAYFQSENLTDPMIYKREKAGG